MNKEAVTLTRFTDRARISHAARRTGSIRVHGMLTRASIRGPSSGRSTLAGAQEASSPPEGADVLFAPPPEFQTSPAPPDASPSWPPPSVTSDLGGLQSPYHGLRSDRAPEGGGASAPRTPDHAVPGGGPRRPAAAGAPDVREADLFSPLPSDGSSPDRSRAATGAGVVDPFLFSPALKSDLFHAQPEEGDSLFQTPLLNRTAASGDPSSAETALLGAAANPFRPSPSVDWLFQPAGRGSVVAPSPGRDSPSPSADAASPAPRSAPPLNLSGVGYISPAGGSLDTPSPGRPSVPPGVMLTTPLGSKHGILQPTPFSLALAATATPQGAPPALPSGSSFRRPPKPLPRVRPPRPALQPAALPAEQSVATAAGKVPPKPPPRPSRSPVLRAAPSPSPSPEPFTSGAVAPAPPAPEPALALSPITPFASRGLAPTLSPTLSPTLTPVTASNPEPWMTQRPAPGLTPALTSTSTPAALLSDPRPPPPAAPTPLTPVVTPSPTPAPRLRQAAEKETPEEDVVYLDILLTGQERCVEDWPEDSPQLDPNFKPSGTLRLRRESMRVSGASDGEYGDGYSPLDHPEKKKGRLFKKSSTLKGSFKDQYFIHILNVSNVGKGKTLRASKHGTEPKADFSHHSLSRKSQDAFPEFPDDKLADEMDSKPKNKAITRLGTFLRRSSETAAVHGGADPDHSPWAPAAKDGDGQKLKVQKSDSVTRRWSDGMLLDEEEEEDMKKPATSDKKKNKLEIKFVPQRGFAISRVKSDAPEEMNSANGYTPHASGKAAFLADGYGDGDASARQSGDFGHGVKDCRPKHKASQKLNFMRRSSKEDMLDEECSSHRPGVFAETWADDEEDGLEDYKQKNLKHKSQKLKTSQKNSPQMGSYMDDEEHFPSPWRPYEDDEHGMDAPKSAVSQFKLKGLKKHKAKVTERDSRQRGSPATMDNPRGSASGAHGDPPGATSSDYYRSEAAEAEWLAAQKDERLAAGLDNGDDEGDTDSLMEWWNTVEKWDEVPSDDEDLVMREDETRSFTVLGDKVHRGLRVFDKVFTERGELLWQYIVGLHAVTDDISEFHRKAKIANITGGTTTAVGGVAAITGLALIPVTFGASLLLTAIGVGVVAAGSITSASASISDSVNNMHDRKKLEILLKAYEALLLDLDRVLRFLNQGLYRLRGHPLLRAGNQHYAADWEVRRAVQTASQVDEPVARASAVTEQSLAALRGLFQGMDNFFVKDSRELKKGAKAGLVAEVRGVLGQLNDGLVELSAIRQELQDATGASG